MLWNGLLQQIYSIRNHPCLLQPLHPEKRTRGITPHYEDFGARFSEESTLLISGVKGRFNTDGQLTDPNTIEALQKLSENIKTCCNFFILDCLYNKEQQSMKNYSTLLF